ncbi:molybdopterin converting factor subunit 1 [Chitinivorax sp. PXF-14]|uniref:molybdopterin converting factor subunit 1 n=1 Tax=Chitinivorax sp. PXF-14 TaxID=3230488 RepID=UPI0034651831
MQCHLLYFARLREVFGTSAESLELPDEAANVAALLDLLRARGGVWSDELASGRSFRVAVNQDMVGADAPLKAGDEVAIFPPVTGG